MNQQNIQKNVSLSPTPIDEEFYLGKLISFSGINIEKERVKNTCRPSPQMISLQIGQMVI